jgi:redox-sensitive bicupin YhaK (pirin superfamily)
MPFIFFPSDSRGKSNHGWLQSRFSFSFAEFYNPALMGFGKLRVLNDDIIAPNNGFPMHRHVNMEIVTIVTSGVVAHEDSLRNKAQVKAGEIQIMSAGTGIVHSETNPSPTEPLKLFQIWIEPKVKYIEPRYDQKEYSLENLENNWELLVSPDKENLKTLWINQDAYFSMGNFEGGETSYKYHEPKNGLYLFVIEGEIEVLGQNMSDRDAIGIRNETEVSIKILKPAKLLAIEVAFI